jgi:hypothetical protein
MNSPCFATGFSAVNAVALVGQTDELLPIERYKDADSAARLFTEDAN